MLRLLLPLTALALAGCATTEMAAIEGAPPMVSTAAVPTVPVPLMKEVISRLASDEFEGRGPGTRAEDLTITEIIARFKAAGVQPGNNGQWLQEVPTVEITANDVSPLTVSGKGQPLRFAYSTDFVAGSYRVVPQTRIADSELVFVGYGIVAPELDWNDYAGVDMNGKTVSHRQIPLGPKNNGSGCHGLTWANGKLWIVSNSRPVRIRCPNINGRSRRRCAPVDKSRPQPSSSAT